MHQEKILTDEQKIMITQLAASKLFARDAPPVILNLNMVLAVGLIGQLQLAFRHPENVGPTRRMTEKLVLDLIDRIDPEHGEVYAFLMMGFDPECDGLADLVEQES